MNHRKWFGNFHKIALGITLLSVSEVSVVPVYGGKGEVVTTVGCSAGTGLLGYWLGKRSVPAPLPSSSWGKKEWGLVLIGGTVLVGLGAVAGHFLWPNESATEPAANENTEAVTPPEPVVQTAEAEVVDEETQPAERVEIAVQTELEARGVRALEQDLADLRRQNEELQEEFEGVQGEYRLLNPMVAAFEEFAEDPIRFVNFGAMGAAGRKYRGLQVQLRSLQDLDGFKVAIQRTVWKYRDGENMESQMSPTAARQMSLTNLQKQVLAFMREIYTKSLDTTNNLSRSVKRLTTENLELTTQNGQLLNIIQSLAGALGKQMQGTGDVFVALFPEKQRDNPWAKSEASLQEIMQSLAAFKNSAAQDEAGDEAEGSAVSNVVALFSQSGNISVPKEAFEKVRAAIQQLLRDRNEKSQLAYFFARVLHQQMGYLDVIYVTLIPDGDNNWWHRVADGLSLFQNQTRSAIPYVGGSRTPLALKDETSIDNAVAVDPSQTSLQLPNGTSLSLKSPEEAEALRLVMAEIEKLRAAEKEAEAVKLQIQEKTLVLERLQAEKAQLEKENAEQAVHFKQSQDELTAELNTSKQDASQKQALLEAQQTQDAERQQRITALEKQINQTKSELTASAAKVKELEAKAAEAAQLRTQVVEVRKQIEVIHTTHVDRNQLINDLNELIVKYTNLQGADPLLKSGIITLLKGIKQSYESKK